MPTGQLVAAPVYCGSAIDLVADDHIGGVAAVRHVTPGRRSTVGWSGIRNRVRTVALVAAVTTLLSGCGFLEAQEPVETVVIGATLELTGADAEIGTVYRNALELRIDQINSQGLLPGRRLELRVLDSRSDPGTAVSNVNELAGDPAVSVIVIGACVPCAMAVAEVADQLAVPVIALSGPEQVVTPLEQRQYVFKLNPNPAETALALSRELDRVNATTVGVVAVDNAYGDDGIDQLEALAAQQGFDLVVVERISNDDDSVAAAAAAVASWAPEPEPGIFPPFPVEPTGPDAVVLWAPASLTARVATALRDRGFEGYLFLDAIAASDVLLSGQEAQALNGATMVFTESLVIDEVIATSPARAARKTWFRAYVARYGNYHAFSAFGADAVDVVVNALNRMDTVDRATLRATLESTQLDGVAGAIRMSPRHHSGLMQQALQPLVARQDRWQLAR